jgi:hypothetical protein
LFSDLLDIEDTEESEDHPEPLCQRRREAEEDGVCPIPP